MSPDNEPQIQETIPTPPTTLPEMDRPAGQIPPFEKLTQTEPAVKSEATKPSQALEETIPHLPLQDEDTAADMTPVSQSVVSDTAINVSHNPVLQRHVNENNITMKHPDGVAIAGANAQEDYKENPQGFFGYMKTMARRLRPR